MTINQLWMILNIVNLHMKYKKNLIQHHAIEFFFKTQYSSTLVLGLAMVCLGLI
jgi:hypothetical protein